MNDFRRDIAIRKTCSILEEEYSFIFKDKVALDFFAREGDWQTKYYAKKVKHIHAWEINPSFAKQLRKNLFEYGDVVIGDSFKLADETNIKFDIIVFDNPQGCYGENNSYCEHFEALKFVPKLLNDGGGLVVFNVKLVPWKYDDKKEWKKRRNEFYKMKDCSNLSKDFIDSFYNNLFTSQGFKVDFSFMVKRPQEGGLYLYTIKLSRKSNL